MSEVKCPSCGQTIEFDEDNDTVVCEVCNTVLNVMLDPDGDGTTYLAEIV